MRVLYPHRLIMTPWRATSFLIFSVVCLVTFCINIHLLRRTSKSAKDNLSDDELCRRFGIGTSIRKFIKADPAGILLDDVQAYRSNLLITRAHREDDVKLHRIRLNINKSDVLVLLHIQKTGGTYLEDNLVQNLQVFPRISCKPMFDSGSRPQCECLNDKGQDWLFNRHCTGWPCGVHHSLDDLTSCMDAWFSSQDNEQRSRKYFYITALRDPVTRFFSEWLHVRRGATWKESRLSCGGKDASLADVPFCYSHGTWANVSFEEFMNCSSNPAFNRQTRMLANMSVSDCLKQNSTLSRHERDELMLQSAKDNLARLFTFFSLLEYMSESKLLFEKTFVGLRFRKTLVKRRLSHYTMFAVLSEHHWNDIVDKNLLDIRLYQFAKDLLLQRLSKANIEVCQREKGSMRVGEDFRYVIVER